ncbi:MBL fold metallo-hydrolase [Compostimonas suwonensis]|uniref:Glyoxylase-like metal-dependent hydrolase (Beta-lactamase superfamily II) n=1 Tax=Compostimonas suwonensis TaxID=1048394 RepID=A0A2M9C4M6_9MICO|nr:MBL fold metallo-hydrolase [Compostimonas suwonensis]PJJ65462.1 glyoxylase-like metal-dependent hydrolase (beta-lactamase superfamily II) [Compostimonas suwonensis]
MTEWSEVAHGVYQRRYEPLDISVVVIAGDDGLLVVDTRSNPAEGGEIVADVARRFGGSPIRWVVNSHAHYDHTFGNQRLGPASEVNAQIYGHHLIPRHFEDFEAPRIARGEVDPARPLDPLWADVVLTPPTHPVDTRTLLGLGGRVVELVPLAPGHTDTDLVVLVPDARVWVVGDIVEQSGPPLYGSGCFPFGWPNVLDGLLTEIEPGDLIVPGHGTVVDRAFVERQSAQLRVVADRIRASWVEGLSIDQALAPDAAPWPFPSELLRPALSRGYDQLAST